MLHHCYHCLTPTQIRALGCVPVWQLPIFTFFVHQPSEKREQMAEVLMQYVEGDKEIIKSELRKFIMREGLFKVQEPLDAAAYWEQVAITSPRLAKFAKALLTIAPTEASVERAFSHRGTTTGFSPQLLAPPVFSPPPPLLQGCTFASFTPKFEIPLLTPPWKHSCLSA